MPHLGHVRESEPSSLAGKMCGPSISFSASSTSPTRRSLMLSMAPVKSRQKSRSTSLYSISPERNEIELFLQRGREIEFDVLAEEAFEERDDEAALVLRDEAFLVDADVVALLQHGERGGVGRRAADAEFFHALDEGRFGKARRRLREMLLGLDGAVADLVAFVETSAGGGSAASSSATIVLALVRSCSTRSSRPSS